MPGPSGESCGACYFFVDGTGNNECISDGICHRYPLMLYDNDVIQGIKCNGVFFQPDVEIDDWCGEFKPLKPEGTE